MDFYLIRHTHAVDLVPDEARMLSDRGREQARALGKFLRRSEAFAPEEIWHSTLVRARETAVLVAEEVKFRGKPKEVAGLRPEDDPAQMARKLAASERPVALFGHEPFMSSLGALLVTGDAGAPVFEMKKGAALALHRAGRRWIVRWFVAPSYLGWRSLWQAPRDWWARRSRAPRRGAATV